VNEGRELAVLVANGPDVDAARLRAAAARPGRVLVGVDGGAMRLLALGLVPDVVTGDFDSLPTETRDVLACTGVRVVPTPDQDYTDLDKALTHCIDGLGARECLVFGATGGRLDHVYSVLSAVLKHGRRARVRLVDAWGETERVNGPRTLSADDTVSGAPLPGRILSLLSFGLVESIHLDGVRWPLSGESLAPGVRDGTLNEIVADTVTLRVGSGEVLVMLHHEGPGVGA
jgi:thiamine pyrophosphokinase